MSARTAEVRRRRTTEMGAALIIARPIRARPVFVKQFAVIPGSRGAEVERRRALDHGIPRRRNQPVAGAVLFDMAEPRERIMKALHRELLGNHHVVNPAPGFLREVAVLVEGAVPGRMA